MNMFPEGGGLGAIISFIAACIAAFNTFKYVKVYLKIMNTDEL